MPVDALDLAMGGSLGYTRIDRALFPDGAPARVSPLDLARAQRGAIRRAAAALAGFVGALGDPPWTEAVDVVVGSAVEDVVRVALHALRARSLAQRDAEGGVPAELARLDRAWSSRRDRLPKFGRGGAS
jgi:hypothetical protein